MAIMRWCCCCGVRGGSIASAIYSMVIAFIAIGSFTYNLVFIDAAKDLLYELQLENPDLLGGLDIDSYISAEKGYLIFGDIILISLLISSIIVLVGINQDAKNLLIPFIATKAVGFLWYFYAFALNIYVAVAIGTEYAGYGIAVGMVVVLGPFFAGDVTCMLCVLSQYQEYRDGRGRDDQIVGQTVQQRTVIIQHQMPAGAGGFAYQHMDEPPQYYPSPEALPTHKNPSGAI